MFINGSYHAERPRGSPDPKGSIFAAGATDADEVEHGTDKRDTSTKGRESLGGAEIEDNAYCKEDEIGKPY